MSEIILRWPRGGLDDLIGPFPILTVVILLLDFLGMPTEVIFLGYNSRGVNWADLGLDSALNSTVCHHSPLVQRACNRGGICDRSDWAVMCFTRINDYTEGKAVAFGCLSRL